MTSAAASCSSSSSSPPPWTAMALFVVTVLASQLLQHVLQQQQQRKKEDDDNDQSERRKACHNLPESFDRYAWLRRHDRLSFDHIDDTTTSLERSNHQSTSISNQRTKRATSVGAVFIQPTYIPGNKRLSVANDLDRRNEQDYELLPKNFNWSHFERAHDDDGGCGDVEHSPPKSSQQQQPEVTPVENESSCEVDEVYSKQQFVWTAPPSRPSIVQHADTVTTAAITTPSATPTTTRATTTVAAKAIPKPISYHRRSSLGKSPLPVSPTPLDDSSGREKEGVGYFRKSSRPPARRRRSIQVSSRDTTDMMNQDSSLDSQQHPSSTSGRNIPPPEKLRRRTMSYPDYVPLAKIRRFFSLESSDDGGEDTNLDDSQDEEDNEALFRSMNREARARYNARIMPSKVVLIRHGQSMGNIDEFLYATTPDNAMPLTKLGWEQARYTGKVLKEQVLASGSNEPVHFIVSPYVRTVETFHGIVSAWCDPAEFNHIENRDERLTAWYEALVARGLTWHEDPRIREQDFGNYQDPATIKKAKYERHRFGVFYYRFPHGESASDVFDRVSTFLDSLWRSFDFNKSRNYVLITHGISIRVFLARYFRYTIDQFSMLQNPRNCEMVILGHDGAGKLNLEGRCDLNMKENEETHELEVAGHKFHKRLRVLPQKSIRKVKIRISYDDN